MHNQPVITGDDLLTLGEAAALMRTAEATLRYWRHCGTGPRSFKVGRRVMYRRQDVEQFLTESYATATSRGDR